VKVVGYGSNERHVSISTAKRDSLDTEFAHKFTITGSPTAANLQSHMESDDTHTPIMLRRLMTFAFGTSGRMPFPALTPLSCRNFRMSRVFSTAAIFISAL
jgi:hypothetical protein